MRNRLLNLYRGNAKKGSIRADGNTIWLYDFIVSSEDDAYWYGGVSAEGFAKLLAEMSGPVTVRVNSPGGDVFGGRAMAQAIRGYEGEVTVQIDGYAASAASTVAVAGDKVVAAPDAMVMIHRAWTLTIGNLKDHLDTAALLEKIDVTIAERFAVKSGEGDVDWLDLMDKETWFTASEAISAGLIDEVLPEKPDKAANSVEWDLSAFANAPPNLPVDEAPSPAPAPIGSPELSDQESNEIEIAARQRKLAVELL